MDAFYAGGPGEPYFQAVLECDCGWSTGRHHSWKEAGEEMDEHKMRNCNWSTSNE